jgi:hypothetical protein
VVVLGGPSAPLSGITSTLGRGGSDYWLRSSDRLGADEIQI